MGSGFRRNEGVGALRVWDSRVRGNDGWGGAGMTGGVGGGAMIEALDSSLRSE